MSDEKVIVHIERLDPEIENDSHWETFEVPYERRAQCAHVAELHL